MLTETLQIFEQHISIIEGHVKMMDMIRQHTVPDTDDWRKICPMLERAKEMLRMTNGAKRNFVRHCLCIQSELLILAGSYDL